MQDAQLILLAHKQGYDEGAKELARKFHYEILPQYQKVQIASFAVVQDITAINTYTTSRLGGLQRKIFVQMLKTLRAQLAKDATTWENEQVALAHGRLDFATLRLISDLQDAVKAAIDDESSEDALFTFVKGLEINQAFYAMLATEVDLGGPDPKPENSALYRLALPFYRQHHNKWANMARYVWNAIEKKPDDQRSDDQRLVAIHWEKSTDDQRRKQIEYVFKNPPDETI